MHIKTIRPHGEIVSRNTKPAGKSLSTQPPLVQRKLAIGAVNDTYEREADRVAETVMRMPEPTIQRKGT